MRFSSKKNFGEFFALHVVFYHENKRTGLVRAKYLAFDCQPFAGRRRMESADGPMMSEPGAEKTTERWEERRQKEKWAGNIIISGEINRQSCIIAKSYLISSSLCLILLAVSLLFSPHLNQHKKEEEMNVGTNSVKDPRLEQKIREKVGTEMTFFAFLNRNSGNIFRATELIWGSLLFTFQEANNIADEVQSPRIWRREYGGLLFFIPNSNFPLLSIQLRAYPPWFIVHGAQLIQVHTHLSVHNSHPQSSAHHPPPIWAPLTLRRVMLMDILTTTCRRQNKCWWRFSLW